MKKKFIFLIVLLFLNLILIYPRYEHGFHGSYGGSYHHYYPHFRFYPIYPYYPDYPDYTFYDIDRIFVHNLGNVNLDKDLTSDIKDIDKIVFSFGIDGSFNRIESREVYFSDSGIEKTNKEIVEFLNKSNIPDPYPVYNILKTYSFDNDMLKLKFSDNNYYHRYFSYYSEEYYIYTLNYTLQLPYNDSIKSQFDNMLSTGFKNDIDRYIERQRHMKAAGISVFVSGFGLMCALNIASLITLGSSLNNSGVPIAVPGALFFSGLGAGTISLSVGIPLWAASSAKKDYTIRFNE
jgi:hypothetical protein